LSKVRLKDDDYLYASARVRARAVNGINGETLLRMADAPELSDALRIAAEHGISVVTDADGAPDTETTIEQYLTSEYDIVQGFTADPQIYGILRYPYDAHNIKSAIKNEVRGSASDSLLIDLGSVKASDVPEMLAGRDFSAYPENMAKAAEEAIEEYDKLSDPQVIDLIIDKACYADMLALASTFNKKFLAETVRTKIDVTNILTVVRVVRMGLDSAYFENCFINGGTLDLQFCKRLISSEKEAFRESVSRAGYAYLADVLEAGGRLAEAELKCENCYIEKLRSSYMVPYGPEVPYAYLALKDIEAKNIRIILTGKKVGLAPAEIRKKLRGI